MKIDFTGFFKRAVRSGQQALFGAQMYDLLKKHREVVAEAIAGANMDDAMDFLALMDSAEEKGL